MSKPISKFRNISNLKIINKDSANSLNEQFKRNLNDDNYMILYFNQECKYSSGFTNK